MSLRNMRIIEFMMSNPSDLELELAHKSINHGNTILSRIQELTKERGTILPKSYVDAINKYVNQKQWNKDKEDFFWILIKYNHCHNFAEEENEPIDPKDYEGHPVVGWLDYIYEKYKGNFERWCETLECDCDPIECECDLDDFQTLDLVDYVLMEARQLSELELVDSLSCGGELSNILYEPMEGYYC